ncbi:YdcF family protein [Acetivibrio straminisolvens]|uniref:Integral membrane protein n=1 Tax=Acetivibrio straminisolvens JCM 21531 TaxID=1294263 RepID=W4VAI8_9FIRM|nr:YdcF family protein [Acetivibrio straminisolvens]GAE89823.1 integral membrane protein [Acetivibrio straminisolvens JCM 21531]
MKLKIGKIFDVLMLIIGVLGILDFLMLMAIGTVINFGILFPLVAGIVLTFAASVRLAGKGDMLRIKNTVLRRLFAGACIAFAASFVLIQGLIISSSFTDKNVEVDYMVILGAGLKGDQITPTFRNRLDKGIEYLRANPELKVVVTGGQGPGEDLTEAEAMRRYLVNHGIEEDRIILEDRATSTNENMKYTAEVLKNLTGRSDYRIMIVTNEFHMFRSKILARHNGFTPYGITAPTNPVVLVNSYIREYFAIVKSLIFDVILD